MNFIKNNMKLIIGIVIGLTCATVVGATVYQYQATDVVYGNTNVSSAINDLYTSVDASSESYGLKVDSLLYANTGSAKKTYTCPSGKTCLAKVYIAHINSSAYVQIGDAIAYYGEKSGSNGNGYYYVENYSNDFIFSGGTNINVYNADSSQYTYMVVYSLK